MTQSEAARPADSGYRCNLCGSQLFQELLSFEGWSIVSCQSCGLRSRHPLPSEQEAGSYYDDQDYLASNYFQLGDRARRSNHYRQFERVADLAQQRLGDQGRLLEVGPGQGEFLNLCFERGVKAEAVEASSRLAGELEQRFPGRVRLGTLETISLEKSSFDMVVAFDLLEHCLDPMGWLTAVSRLLKSGGLLALSTVSIQNLLDGLGRLLYQLGLRGPARKLYPKYHLYYFTPQLLFLYLEGAGLKPIQLVQINYDPRKASSNPLERAALKMLYAWHNISGHKTNLYVITEKIAQDSM